MQLYEAHAGLNAAKPYVESALSLIAGVYPVIISNVIKGMMLMINRLIEDFNR